jgi:hypothetical protein
MSPKELAEKHSKKIFENENVLFIEIYESDAIEYYGSEYSIQNYKIQLSKGGRTYLVVEKNGDNNYYIFVSRYGVTQVDNSEGDDVDLSVVLNTYPELEPYIFDNVDENFIYKTLLEIKKGKIVDRWDLRSIDKNIVKITYRKSNLGDSSIKIHIDESDFFNLFDKDENRSLDLIKQAFYGSGFHSYDYIKHSEWREGYMFDFFNTENIDKINDILKYFGNYDVTDRNNYNNMEKITDILENHFDVQVYDIIDKFTDLANESLGDYIKSEVKGDVLGVLKKHKIFNKNLFEYYTTVDDLIKVYQNTGKKTFDVKNLFKFLFKKIEFKNYEDDSYNFSIDDESFNETVSEELDEMFEKLENEPEKYEKFISFAEKLNKLKKMGYEIGKTYPLPYDNKKQFKIEEINKDTEKIILYYFSGVKDAEKRSLSLEEFYNFLNTPELFEHLVRKLKKLL